MEAEFAGDRSRGDVVRSAESGEEIVESARVRHVDYGEASAPLVLIAAEKIVVADGDVEEVALRDARRVAVVVFSPRRGHGGERGPEGRSGTNAGAEGRRDGRPC